MIAASSKSVCIALCALATIMPIYEYMWVAEAESFLLRLL